MTLFRIQRGCMMELFCLDALVECGMYVFNSHFWSNIFISVSLTVCISIYQSTHPSIDIRNMIEYSLRKKIKKTKQKRLNRDRQLGPLSLPLPQPSYFTMSVRSNINNCGFADQSVCKVYVSRVSLYMTCELVLSTWKKVNKSEFVDGFDKWTKKG